MAMLCAAHTCRAEVSYLCDHPSDLTAIEQDRLLRFGAIIKKALQQSGQSVALVSRSGLDLKRFDIRYSHAGVALKGTDEVPWSIRQLYYECDVRKPLIFDQGISGFLLGTSYPALGYVSVVTLPDAPSAELARAAIDKQQALQVLGATYSANAYPFSDRYQNCNQWVIELLAMAWGQLNTLEQPRVQAQHWLKAQGYEPSEVNVGYRLLMWATPFIPLVHNDDHPSSDLDQQRYRISMPASIEAFVHRHVPQATRIEFCYTDQHVVIHEGWDAIAEGCVAGEHDTKLRWDSTKSAAML